MDSQTAHQITLRALREVIQQNALPEPETIDGDTVLVGPDAVIDSLGVVSLIVEIEQIVEGEHGVSIILANEKAMSAKNSPFRSVGVLSEHIIQTVKEAEAA